MLLSQGAATLNGGVSQQATTERSANQVEEQVNCINSLVSGLRTRQGTWLNAKLQIEGQDTEPKLIYQLKRDRFEQYVIYVGASGIKVYDRVTGNSYPVEELDNSFAYLGLRQNLKPYEAYRLATSADTTYILNKTVPVYRKLQATELPVSVGIKRRAYRINAIELENNNDVVSMGTYRHGYNGIIVNTSADQSVAVAASKLRDLLENNLPAGHEVTLTGNTLFVDVPEAASFPVITDTSTVTERETEEGEQSTEYTFTVFTIYASDTSQPIDITGREYQYLIYVSQVDYSVSYKITVNGTLFTVSTPEATTTRARAGLSLASIHGQIRNQLATIPELNANATSSGSYVKLSSSTPLTITVSDDLNDLSIMSIGRTVPLFSDLPPKAPANFYCKVTGSDTSDTNGYWVTYDLDENAWVESRDPYQVHELDRTTMPHVLVRRNKPIYADTLNPLGIYFTFGQNDWSNRLFGDDDVTPFPSFVSEWDSLTNTPIRERSITAMTFHRNRLVFSSDENVIMSEAAVYNNFFRTTAEVIKDSDTIDVGILTTDINPIETMLSAQNELILYGTKRQFSLRSGDTLSASTIYADPLSSYDVDGNARPAFSGDMVFFVVRRNGFNGVYISSISEQQNFSTEISSHVPTYIKGKPKVMAVSATESRLFVLTEDNAKAIYVYDFKVVNRENVHSAWSKWLFKDDVLDISVEDSTLHIITKTGNSHYSEYMNLDHDKGESEYGFKYALDRLRVKDISTVIDPLDIEVNTTTSVLVGRPIEMRVRLSQLYLRDKEGVVQISGSLRVRTLEFDFTATRKCTLETSREGRVNTNNRLISETVGNTGLALGAPVIFTGQRKFGVYADAQGLIVDIKSNDYIVTQVQGMRWIGQYRAKRRSL
jgi:hypothetical protein